jgi:tetratricopeptide (TPR) repeat protein
MQRLSSAPEAQHASLNEDLDKIQEALQAIGAMAPGLIELRVQRKLLQGDVDGARSLAREALNMEPGRASLHRLVADIAIQTGELAVGERHLQKVAEAVPWDTEPLLALVEIHAARNDLPGVVRLLEQAVERAPSDAAIMAQLVSAYSQAERMEDALRLARELNRKHPDRADGFALLAQLLFSQGQTEEAIALSEDAVTRHPRESALHVMLYLLHLTNGDAEKATAALDRFSEIDPEARMRIAEALLQAMQIEPAVALMEEELRVRPERMEVAMTLAQLHRYQGNSEAITRLRAHIGEHAPDRDAALVSFDKALEEIDSQLQSTPPPSDVQNAPDAPLSPPGETKPSEEGMAPEEPSASPPATPSTP